MPVQSVQGLWHSYCPKFEHTRNLALQAIVDTVERVIQRYSLDLRNKGNSDE